MDETIILETEKTFGKILKQYRKEKNISHEKFAFKCELDRTYISLLERGQRNPTLNSIFRISKGLRIKPNKMIEDTEKLIEMKK